MLAREGPGRKQTLPKQREPGGGGGRGAHKGDFGLIQRASVLGKVGHPCSVCVIKKQLQKQHANTEVMWRVDEGRPSPPAASPVLCVQY